MADAAVVLDASALLAHLNDEPGANVVEDALMKGAAISAVNLAEVLSKLAEIGEDPARANEGLWRRGLLGTNVEVHPLTVEDAVVIADLHRKTRSHGLSLGDRACLGLALRLQLPAITADRTWSRLRVGVKVETIR
jgi:ribonuclease VapC